MRPEILTIGGRYFNFVEPNVWDVQIEDIAYALSRICRYTGHCRGHYSVAQHSVLVSHIIDPAYAYEGLMHDIGEALYGDVSAPLKQLLPDFKKIEHRIEVPLLARFGIAHPLPWQVKDADLRMLSTEKRDLMHRNAGEWVCEAAHPPVDRKIRWCWPAWYARWRFLRRYKELSRARDADISFASEWFGCPV